MDKKDLKHTVIIGLEVHVELNTVSKMFCACPTDHFQIKANTHTCPVCLALPGALPVPNRKAIDFTIMVGLGLGCSINKFSYFERKNYFYPDLAKGYQISQYEKPFCFQGKLKIGEKNIRINRVHLEEDTAKLQHRVINGEKASLIDFNRSGVPLVEIVSEPDCNSSKQAVLYLKELRQVIRDLGVSDCDMEKGSMRLEPTVNLKIEKNGQSYFTPLTELKNINSFRFVKKAIDFETNRHLIRFLKENITKDKYPKETRGYDESTGETKAQRQKEDAHDYRYFPEPDIPPIRLSNEKIDKLQKSIPETSKEKKLRFEKCGLKKEQAKILSQDKKMADLFEKTLALSKKEKIKTINIANTIINKKLNIEKISPEELIVSIKLKSANLLSDKNELKKIVLKIAKKNLGQVEEYKTGKVQLLGFFMGRVMQETKGKADPKIAREALKELLAK